MGAEEPAKEGWALRERAKGRSFCLRLVFSAHCSSRHWMLESCKQPGGRGRRGGTGGRRAVSGTLLKMLLIVIEPRKVETQSHHVARGAAVVEHLPLSFSSGRAWMYFLLVLPALCVCVCVFLVLITPVFPGQMVSSHTD